jgi:hypothetical protein
MAFAPLLSVTALPPLASGRHSFFQPGIGLSKHSVTDASRSTFFARRHDTPLA